jgi:hypothetical protein
MTANQIAAASERELERHNATVEEETIRHNEALESVERTRNEITDRYQSEKNRLDDWYNKAYIEYLNSSTERKNELEQELNNIKLLQVENENDYKQQMAVIERDKYAADKSYKEMMAQIGYMGADIEARRAEYSHWADVEKLSLSYAELEAAQVRALAQETRYGRELDQQYLKMQQDYNIQLQNVNISYLEQIRKLSESEVYKDLMTSEIARNYVNATFQGINAANALPMK